MRLAVLRAMGGAASLAIVASWCAAVAAAPERRTDGGRSAASPAPSLHAIARGLAIGEAGPFVRLADGGLLAVRGDDTLVGREGGAAEGFAWERVSACPGGPKLRVRPEQAIVRTRDGAAVVVFMDDLDKRWSWDEQRNAAGPDVRLRAWAARSEDGGRTWGEPALVQDGYCGAVRDIIETRSGRLVVPTQRYSPEGARHVTVPHVSDDGGRTWRAARELGVPGRGHHDGAFESTLVERRDGSIWLLLRTNLGALYESTSRDGGLTWTDPSRTEISASSSPALVKRLASGRLLLLWNRERSGSGAAPPRRGGQYSAAEASWFRDELSAALSDDDGATWTSPVVLARREDSWLSYPYLLEPEPGRLWITTMQGGVRLEVSEADLEKACKGAGR